MGGGGGGGGVDLSRGAVAAMSHQVEGLRPVLQVAAAPWLIGSSSAPAAKRYGLVLSDGWHLQMGVLATSLGHLVTAGALRRGAVIRVLEYFSGVIQNRRAIIVIQLEVLQAECTLIGSPTIYEANPTQHIAVPCSSGLGSPTPCFMAGAQQVVSHSLCFPGHGLLDSSVTPRAEPAVSNLPFGECLFSECFCSMPAHSTVDAKMQQLSLTENENQRFMVTAKDDAYDPPGKTYGSPMPLSFLHSTPSHIARYESPPCITSINALNPYQARWKIKARVTAKADLRHFTNSKGAGKVFSFDLLDAQGGEIRAVCFNLQADLYFDLIEVDKVYLISKGSLKPAQKKFNPLNNDYEILVDHTTSIEICCGDESSFTRQQYNFRRISEIEDMEIGAFVDLVGIVTSVGPSATAMQKDGIEGQKRTLQLNDMSGRSVDIIFWDKFCNAEGQQLQLLCDSGSNPTLALKGGRISDFKGRSVVTTSSTQLKVNPNVPVADMLKQWYMVGGKTAPCVSLSHDISSLSNICVQKTIAHIKDENLGRSDKPDLITVRAAIWYVAEDKLCYPACTLELNGKRCNRKVTSSGDGTWYCDRCNQCSEKCEYKYSLLCQIKDRTGTIYTTASEEAAEEIVGCTAQELFTIRNVEQDEERLKFAVIMAAILFRDRLFKLRIKAETFNGEQHVECCIVGVEKLDASGINHHRLEGIGNLSKDLSHAIPMGDSSYSSSSPWRPLTGIADIVPRYRHLNRMPPHLSASSAGFTLNDVFMDWCRHAAGKGGTSL